MVAVGKSGEAGTAVVWRRVRGFIVAELRVKGE